MNIKKKILIIEDTIDILELYKIYFEGAGFEVHTSINGLDGIAKAVEINPDAILLDIMMPQMNGFEVLETIKNQTSINIPIIICSNISKKSDIDKAYNMGADLYLRKSDYEGQEVVDKVVSYLKENKLI